MLSNLTPFVSQSVTTMQFVALLRPDSGRSVMKSIEISPHMRSGIGSGLRSPFLVSLYIVFLPQISQLRTNRRTSLAAPDQKNCLDRIV
jgi:hypothetical protein